MDFASVFARVVEVLSKPVPATWDRLYTSPSDKQQALIELALSLSVFVVLFFLFGIFHSVGGYALVAGVLQAAAIIGMVFGTAYATDLIAPYFGALKIGDQGVRLFAWASLPIAAVAALYALLAIVGAHLGGYVYMLGVGYGAYHVFVAAPLWYGVPDAKRLPFVGAIFGIWAVGLYASSEIAMRIAF